MKALPPLTPETSPLGKSRWLPFVVDEPRHSYAFVLPFEEGLERKCGDVTIFGNKGAPFNKQQDTSWTNKRQLDDWFDALHPSRYQHEGTCHLKVESAVSTVDKGTAWTDSYYKGELLLRKTAWVTLDQSCQCDYGYSDTWQTRATSTRFLKTIQTITRQIREVTGCTSLNACNLNYYPEGGGVGFHADDEFLFDGLRNPTCIVSLSLCRGRSSTQNEGVEDSNGNEGSRKFLVKLKGDETEETTSNEMSSSTYEQILQHGDLMTMEGMFQKHYFHSVWPGDSKDYMDDPYTQGERINLTWRTITQHLDGSDECKGKVCQLSKSFLE